VRRRLSRPSPGFSLAFSASTVTRLDPACLAHCACLPAARSSNRTWRVLSVLRCWRWKWTQLPSRCPWWRERKWRCVTEVQCLLRLTGEQASDSAGLESTLNRLLQAPDLKELGPVLDLCRELRARSHLQLALWALKQLEARFVSDPALGQVCCTWLFPRERTITRRTPRRDWSTCCCCS
jgi:hypothetical protein